MRTKIILSGRENKEINALSILEDTKDVMTV